MSDPGVNVNNLIASVNAASGLDPSIHVGIANSSPDAATAAQTALAVEGYGQTTTRVNQLRAMSVGAQLQAWNALPPDQQSMYVSAGYKPPASPHHGGGGVLGAIGGAFSEVGSALGTAGKDVLNASGSPLRAVQHAYRTLDVLHQEAEGQGAAQQEAQKGLGGPVGVNPGGIKLAFSPHAWADAWNTTEHGERTYNPAIVRQLTSQYGAGTVESARAIANTNMDPKKLQALNNYPQLAQQFKADPDLQAAVKALLGSKISFGRTLVGEKFTVDHPAAAAAISGPVDAAFDFFGDPLNVPLGVGTDLLHARYAVSSGADVYRLAETKGAVQDYIDQAARFIENKDMVGLTNRFSSLRPALAPLSKAVADGTVHDKTTFIKWLADSADEGAFASGQGFKITRVGATIEHAGPTSDALALLKSTSQDAIDFLADKPVIGGPFRSVQRITQLIPKGFQIVPSSDAAPSQFRDLVGLALPRQQADDLTNLFALGDTKAKRQLYASTLQMIFQQTGWYDNPKLAERARQFVAQVAEDPTNELYSKAISDKLVLDGAVKPSGILGTQVLGGWELPDAATLLAQKNKATLGGRAVNLINNDGIDAFMQEGWKPLQLLRLGFAPRVAGEEAFGAMLRDGFAGLARARLAASSVAGQAAGTEDRVLPWHPLHSTLAALSDHLPEGTVRDIVSGENPTREFFAQTVGDATRRAFRNVEGKLAGDEYVNAARELYDRYGPSLVADEISAVHNGGVDYLDSGGNQLRASKKGLERRSAAIIGNGNFAEYNPGQNELFLQVYKRDLEEIANDYLGRNALRNFGNRDQQVADVMAAIESPQARELRNAASRYSVLRDGRTVGVDAVQEEATRDWANAVVDHVNYHLHDTNGTPIADLAERLKDGKAPSVPELAEIPKDRLPVAIHGPETVAVAPPSAYRQLLENGFHEMVGRPMNWMSRQPMFVHNYVLAKRDLQGLADALGNTEAARQLVTDRAAEGALGRTIPYIHDPQLRSQFSTTMRNLMPFEFAQEQFYKRWARTFAYAPDSFRKAMLVAGGLSHSGLTHTDANGNEYFDYPLIGQLQADVLNPILNGVLGYNAMMPVTAGFAGEVKNISPGLSHIGPSFGPLISIPTKYLANRYPELQPLNQAIEGQAGANTNYLEQVVPASMYRFLAAADPSSATYASAEAQAIQNLEASGHGLPDNATSGERQQYLDRLKNWTRTTVLLRAVLGFVGPTAPAITPGRQDIPKRFSELMQTMTISQAQAELINEYGPDATPYTVFRSKTPGKADLPAAQSTLSMMNDHIEFFSKYPLAGGWLLPSVSDSGKFSDTAYLEQLAMGMRERKAPGQMLNDVVYARDAPTYYKNLDTYEKLKLQYANNYTQKAKVENAWSDWQAQYFKAHPVFGDEVQNSTSATDRGDIVREMQKALADPSLPVTPTSQAISGLVTNYVNFQAMQAKYKALHTSAGSKALANLENAFAGWSEQYVKAHPEATVFYQRIVRPDVGGVTAQADIQAGDQAAAADQASLPVAS